MMGWGDTEKCRLKSDDGNKEEATMRSGEFEKFN